MALDGTKVRANPGTLTYTPNGGSALAIGFTNDGVQLFVRNRWKAITPEEFGETPLDYINLGGPIIAVCSVVQWDTATMNALAGWAISGSDLVFATSHIGQLASALQYGALAFSPTTSGHLQWSAARAVPLIAEEKAFAPQFRKREWIEFGCTFALLPPTGGGTIITIGESGGGA